MLFSTPLLLCELNNGCSMQGTALQTPWIRGDRLKTSRWPASRPTDKGSGWAAGLPAPGVGQPQEHLLVNGDAPGRGICSLKPLTTSTPI